MNEIAVVTAVTDNYDYIGGHSGYLPTVDYLFFTDGTSKPVDDVWKVRELPTDVTSDPRRQAKIPKINPHMIPELNEYNYVIWIDGSMQIKTSKFVPSILSYLDNGLVLSPHFDGRDCGYGEATIRPPKYADEPLDEQCEFYLSEGFPYHYGLYECGVEARDMTVPIVKQFGEVWFQQIMDWSTQDQVSCGYALWKTGLKPDVLEKSWREYNWLHINAHQPREYDYRG